MDVSTRLALIAAMFSLTSISGLLPIAIIKTRGITVRKLGKTKRTMQACTCFAAGVFLGTSMLALLPNAQIKFNKLVSNFRREHLLLADYPLAELFIVIGFFLVLILEQLMLYVKDRRSAKEKFTSWDSNEMLSMTENCNENYEISHETHDSVDTDMDEHTIRTKPQDHVFSSMLLLVVLSVHSVFEGLALGLQSNLTALWTIFAALVIHKSLIGFSIGMKMLKSRLSPLKITVTVIVFAVMSPTGIALGAVSNDHDTSYSSNFIESVLLALSTGTFLFVTFVEILPHEIEGSEHRLLRLACLIFGCVLIAVVRITPNIELSMTSENITDSHPVR